MTTKHQSRNFQMLDTYFENNVVNNVVILKSNTLLSKMEVLSIFFLKYHSIDYTFEPYFFTDQNTRLSTKVSDSDFITRLIPCLEVSSYTDVKPGN